MQAGCGGSTYTKAWRTWHLRQGRVQRSNTADAAKVHCANLDTALVVVPAGALRVSRTRHALYSQPCRCNCSQLSTTHLFAEASYRGPSHTVAFTACLLRRRWHKVRPTARYTAAVPEVVILFPC